MPQCVFTLYTNKKKDTLFDDHFRKTLKILCDNQIEIERI